jgi:hypothetical protein
MLGRESRAAAPNRSEHLELNSGSTRLIPRTTLSPMARGKHLLRQRGERLERPCAHLYETGRMRRVHLRGHDNILKRLLIHIGVFNLGLLMRHLCGIGTPRSLQGRAVALLCGLWSLGRLLQTPANPVWTFWRSSISLGDLCTQSGDHRRRPTRGIFTTGC